MAQPSFHRGYSLVETVLSLAIVSVLLGSMGSLVVVASKSVPGRAGGADRVTAAAAFLEQFETELGAADALLWAAETGVEFTVADRDGDGKKEKIRYEWGGSGVDRIYNDEPSSLDVVLSGFALEYTLTESKLVSASVVSSAAETSLGGWSGVALYTGRQVDSGKPVAQHFVPTLPASTRSWTITRVRFTAQQDLLAATGVTEVQLRTVGADGLPTGSLLASTTIAESSLPLVFGTVTASFSRAPALAPGQEVAVVFTCSSGCPSMTLGVVSLAVARTAPLSAYAGVWTGNAATVVPHEVFATTTTTTPQESLTTSVESVRVRLKVPDAGQALESCIPLRNRPGAL